MTATPGETSPLMAALAFYLREREAAAVKARKQLGINELDARALTFVGAHPGIRPSALRGHLGVTSAGVTTIVDRLVQRGVLRREQDETDRRVSHIHVVVDLAKEPWSHLARFDSSYRQIIGGLNPATEAEIANFLTHATIRARDEAARADNQGTSAA